MAMEPIPPKPPGARVPASDTSLFAVMGPPAETNPPPEPSVAMANPFQSRAPPMLALRRSSEPPLPVRAPAPEATSEPAMNDVVGVVR